jgi:hypothetical protein
MYKTYKEVNNLFKLYAKEFGIKVVKGDQNTQPCDTRAAYCDFIDSLHRDNLISDKIAAEITFKN